MSAAQLEAALIATAVTLVIGFVAWMLCDIVRQAKTERPEGKVTSRRFPRGRR